MDGDKVVVDIGIPGTLGYHTEQKGTIIGYIVKLDTKIYQTIGIYDSVVEYVLTKDIDTNRTRKGVIKSKDENEINK